MARDIPTERQVIVDVDDLQSVLAKADYVTHRDLVGPVDRMGDAGAIVRSRLVLDAEKAGTVTQADLPTKGIISMPQRPTTTPEQVLAALEALVATGIQGYFQSDRALRAKVIEMGWRPGHTHGHSGDRYFIPISSTAGVWHIDLHLPPEVPRRENFDSEVSRA